MNLSAVITSIRAAFFEAVPVAELHLQLAPQEAQVPYAVLRVGQIEKGESDTGEKDYATTMTFVVVVSSDSDCLAAIDALSDKFDQGQIDDIYSSLLGSASFDIQYTEQAAMWVAESSFSVRWTVRA
jgi:hypothetical protein